LSSIDEFLQVIWICERHSTDVLLLSFDEFLFARIVNFIGQLNTLSPIVTLINRYHEILEIIQNGCILRHVSLVNIGVIGFTDQIVDLEMILNEFLNCLFFLLHFRHLVR
jgi:hypothetical protein